MGNKTHDDFFLSHFLSVNIGMTKYNYSHQSEEDDFDIITFLYVIMIP